MIVYNNKLLLMLKKAKGGVKKFAGKVANLTTSNNRNRSGSSQEADQEGGGLGASNRGGRT